MKATITTHHASSSIARSIAASVSADNVVAPKPLHVTSKARGSRVISNITGAQDVESLLTTIDDLLLCLVASDRLLSTVKSGESRARRRV